MAAWNISNYNGGDASNIATAVYGEFNGRRFEPDVILLQEIINGSALDSLVAALNGASGSPGDWVGAPFFSGGGGGLNTALVYRDSKLDELNSVLVWPGSTSANPRNIVRYDMRLDGYMSEEAVISCYPVHMKAGSSSSSQNRRLIEAQRIRDDAESLPSGRHFILGGDTNTQSSSQPGYQELVGSQSNNAGRFYDPINTPGSWNNNSVYRNIHTQDPVGGGGMDDRHDQLLVSGNFGDGVGLEYVGDFAQP
ncbi:MAG TPA: endonuclease/exonuclease/phosphatase family protein, partial [Phycisphaerales bacterium]|nr:endonuclease/exonuclease/phosphatase family protein [Phycisphaerales bacterium]